MKRFIALLVGDFKLQVKYGFYYVVIPLCLIYVVVLRQFQGTVIEYAAPFLAFSDPVFLGLIFIGAMVYFERSEGTLQALIVTPVKTWEYLISKLVAFSVMGLFAGFIIILPTYGLKFNYALFITGMVLSSAFFSLVGFILITRIPGITEFFLALIPALVILCLPIIGRLGLYDFWLWYLFPANALIILVRAGFVQTSNPELIYSITYSFVSLVLLFFLAKREFIKNVIIKAGGK